MNANTLRRFLTKIDYGTSDGACWEWKGARATAGYGTFNLGPKDGDKRAYHYAYAHRLSYQTFKGEIPEGLVIDHLCRNRGCVNPEHLEAVTHEVNVRRGAAINRPTCPRGHEYDIQLDYGGRRCRTCENEGHRRRYHERKLAA